MCGVGRKQNLFLNNKYDQLFFSHQNCYFKMICTLLLDYLGDKDFTYFMTTDNLWKYLTRQEIGEKINLLRT